MAFCGFAQGARSRSSGTTFVMFQPDLAEKLARSYDLQG